MVGYGHLRVQRLSGPAFFREQRQKVQLNRGIGFEQFRRGFIVLYGHHFNRVVAGGLAGEVGVLPAGFIPDRSGGIGFESIAEILLSDKTL